MPDSTPQIFPRFAGKTVLVTGAGTGFGAEIAVRAAQEGAKVAVVYKGSQDAANAAVAAITQAGGSAIAIQCDVTSADAASVRVASSTAMIAAMESATIARNRNRKRIMAALAMRRTSLFARRDIALIQLAQSSHEKLSRIVTHSYSERVREGR